MENFRLKVFRAVAKHRNFRMAAEELLLTQPAVTQQIKALESELDAALFDRTGGRVALTAAGAALLPFAAKLAALSAEARAVVAATASVNNGTLRLAASQTIDHYLLPRLVAAFLLQHPKVQVEITGGNTQTVLEELAAHRVQLALIEGPAMRQDVRVAPFLEDQMVLVVAAGHEWANEEIAIEQLVGASLLMRELGSGSRRIVENALEAAGLRLRDLTIRMTFDSTEALLTAAEAGLGVAFVSRWAVRSQLALGTLQIAHIRGLRLERMFSIAAAAGPEPTGLAGLFHRFVRQHAATMGLPSKSRRTQGR